MNDREFRQHLVKLHLERERKEAQAANAAVKKPPVTAKSQKAKRKRSAQALYIANPKQRGVEMDTDDGWPKVWAEMSDEELRDRW